MRRNQQYCNNIDSIILRYIKNNKSCTIIDVLKYCISNYNYYNWSYKIIYSSVLRLRSQRKITMEDRRSLISFKVNNKIYKKHKNIYFISYVSSKVFETDNILGGINIDKCTF